MRACMRACSVLCVEELYSVHIYVRQRRRLATVPKDESFPEWDCKLRERIYRLKNKTRQFTTPNQAPLGRARQRAAQSMHSSGPHPCTKEQVVVRSCVKHRRRIERRVREEHREYLW